jgi:hypothetical protein
MAHIAAFLLAAIGLGVSPLAQAECPNPRRACEHYSAIVGIPAVSTGKYCEGPECFEGTYVSEARIVAAEDEGPFPRTWEVWGEGYLVNYSCADPLDYRNEKTGFKVPDTNSCALVFLTDSTYVWLITSDPDSECLGVAECKVVD